MKLQSIELQLPAPEQAARFLVDIWGLTDAGTRGTTRYLRGASTLPYLVALREGPEQAESTTFVCTATELERIATQARLEGRSLHDVESGDPGGGRGFRIALPEGQTFRFLTDVVEASPMTGADLPVRLTHVVFNSADAERTASDAERLFDFRVSDRTKGMVFVRCNSSHHSTAFARAGFCSLNHVAFEMRDIDAVMRGIGRLRDHGLAPAWGPGRHGPGANVFAYFIAPFGPVIEFSTAVDTVPDDYRVGSPADWTWPPNRIDHWGLSDKDQAALTAAEKRFGFPVLESSRESSR